MLWLPSACRTFPYASPWLEQKIVAQVAAITPHSAPVTAPLRGLARDDDEANWNVQLQYGQCYIFSAAAEATIAKIHLFLFDPGGRKVLFRKTGGSAPVMSLCPEAAGTFALRAKVGGVGHYAIGVFASTEPIAQIGDDSMNLVAVAAALARATQAYAHATSSQQPATPSAASPELDPSPPAPDDSSGSVAQPRDKSAVSDKQPSAYEMCMKNVIAAQANCTMNQNRSMILCASNPQSAACGSAYTICSQDTSICASLGSTESKPKNSDQTGEKHTE